MQLLSESELWWEGCRVLERIALAQRIESARLNLRLLTARMDQRLAELRAKREAAKPMEELSRVP
jgi:hypothetical protein